MTNPFDSLVSVYGDTFPLQDIQRIGSLYPEVENNFIVLKYEIYLCTGQIAVIKYPTKSHYIDEACVNRMRLLEKSRQKIIDARWPKAHKFMIEWEDTGN